MTSVPRPGGADHDPVRAVYQPIPIAWPFIVLAPVGLVAVAAVLIVTAVTVREDPAVRAVSVLWSLLALAGGGTGC